MGATTETLIYGKIKLGELIFEIAEAIKRYGKFLERLEVELDEDGTYTLTVEYNSGWHLIKNIQLHDKT